jgi:hypothetical protein
MKDVIDLDEYEEYIRQLQFNDDDSDINDIA